MDARRRRRGVTLRPELDFPWHPVLTSESRATPRSVCSVLVVPASSAPRRSCRGRQNGRRVLDRCPHRGALALEASRAQRCAVCPYHGWSWAPDGTGKILET
ncbi:MAG: Rieske 2Fe-2S domain-containing protein [Sandaracinus sp.]|nr:Rieske 2Fe-2S domain-containing protein [Sandaracinus sp.]